jgi:lipopolysaccharide cholinephosphotransferase
MKELTSDEIKKLSLDIMVNVADFCDKHQIKYSLAYGTLIGAIRHKGFIPWDDDIDVFMMRNDYERFISQFQDERYKIISGENQVNHLHIRVSDNKTKVISKNPLNSQFYDAGIWVDIFPVDKVPDNPYRYKLHKFIVWLFADMQLVGEIGGNNIIKKIAHLPLKPFSKFFGEKVRKRMVKYNNCNSKTVASIGAWYVNETQFPLEYMEDFIDVLFEGHHFKAMKQYDAFLKKIYGDYMKFPPLEKRIASHYQKAYLKE